MQDPVIITRETLTTIVEYILEQYKGNTKITLSMAQQTTLVNCVWRQIEKKQELKAFETRLQAYLRIVNILNFILFTSFAYPYGVIPYAIVTDNINKLVLLSC